MGDLAARKEGDAWIPGIAPAAIQMGKHAAENILRQARGEAPSPFRYRDKGMMATIGRRRAVAWLRGLMVSGWMAWLMWLLVHIVFLVGFRNRVAVLMEWFWAYATYQRSARVIVGHDEKGADPQPHTDPLSVCDKK